MVRKENFTLLVLNVSSLDQELILQYFYVDKYSGTNYDYPDNFQTNGRMTVFASSLISLLIAIGGMANLGPSST